MDLYQRSIEIILENQAASGAYVACPTFPTYQYCWFRDGSFIAYAMDRAGQSESAARFHAWASRVILSRADRVEQAAACALTGQPLPPDLVLHTRYTLDGEVGTREEWPNFQSDGFGTWLWALEQHAMLSGRPLPASWLQAADLVARYLTALWPLPCFDCWEEHPDLVHPHTLAAISGGLAAHARLSGSQPGPTLDAIRAYIETHNQKSGRFTKFPGQDLVDALLLGLAVPYAVFPLADPRVAATAAEIEAALRCSDGDENGVDSPKRGGVDSPKRGGVHRYPTDTYYGGGEWVLLSAWLGWYYARTGQIDRARELRAWCQAQARTDGSLPEQVHAHLNDPAYLPHWQQTWGPSASPLLWSHAMLIILEKELE